MRFVLVVALAGCSALPPAQPHPASSVTAEPPIFAIPGEAMEYRVLLRGITVGRVRVAIGDPGWTAGKRSIIVRSRGESDGFISVIGKLAWELKSTLDLDRGLPIESHEESWAEIAGKSEHDNDDDHWSESETRHDVHSAVCRFRGWHSKPGERFAFELQVGGSHHVEVEAWHTAREYLASAKAPAVRYEGVINEHFKFAAWVSDDPSRVPLRFQTESKFGAIVVELVAYHAP